MGRQSPKAFLYPQKQEAPFPTFFCETKLLSVFCFTTAAWGSLSYRLAPQQDQCRSAEHQQQGINARMSRITRVRQEGDRFLHHFAANVALMLPHALFRLGSGFHVSLVFDRQSDIPVSFWKLLFHYSKALGAVNLFFLSVDKACFFGCQPSTRPTVTSFTLVPVGPVKIRPSVR